MYKKRIGFLICAIAMALTTTQVRAVEKIKKTANNIEQQLHIYSVSLGSSRVIYSPDSRGAVLSVSNPNKYPILVQSSVYTEQKKEDNGKFIITPPLFRLDPEQQSRLRIIMTGKPSSTDRETLYWMCVAGIPPENGDVWNDQHSTNKQTAFIDIRVNTSQCIKLLVRPTTVKGQPQDYASSVTWTYSDKGVTANNPTPFYLNLKSLKIGSTEVKDPQYLPPFGKRTYPSIKAAPGSVKWSLINDIGGESGPFSARVQ